MEDLNKCKKCGAQGKERHEVKETLEDGTEAEYYAFCSECGEYMYFFCYGHYEY